MRIGRSGFALVAALNSQKKWITASLEFNGDNAGNYYQLMEAQREEIDSEAEFELNWEELPNRKMARISVKKTGADPTDKGEWNEQHKWLVNRLNHMYELFHHRVKELDLSDIEGS